MRWICVFALRLTGSRRKCSGFSKLPQTPGYVLSSPKFRVGQLWFRMRLRPGGWAERDCTAAEEKERYQHVALHVQLVDSDGRVPIGLKFSAADMEYSVSVVISSAYDKGTNMTFRRSRLLDAASKNGDAIDFCCEVSMSDVRHVPAIQDEADKSLHGLASDFRLLRVSRIWLALHPPRASGSSASP